MPKDQAQPDSHPDNSPGDVWLMLQVALKLESRRSCAGWGIIRIFDMGLTYRITVIK